MFIKKVILDLYCDTCPIEQVATNERIVERSFENAKLLACRHGWSFKKEGGYGTDTPEMCRCKKCGSENREWPELIEKYDSRGEGGEN